MSRKICVMVFAVGLTACGYTGRYLVPPESRATTSDIDSDIMGCMSEAAEYRSLTPAERELIAGKKPERLMLRGQPFKTPEGYPGEHQLANSGMPMDLADRYAVCLLNRGYEWEDTGN
jgi:hypothetical protein